MNSQELLQNKPFLIAVAAGSLLLIVLILALVFGGPKSDKEKIEHKKSPVLKEDVRLLTTSDVGKVLEIQSLLAREGITVRQSGKGAKIDLILAKEDKITEVQRDAAIMTIVKSGVMDKNIGLEIFDKGDFTSSREDKRIRLARAINGELARLIKKIPEIEDASVFVSIPKDTVFTSQQKPKTATIQLVVAPGREKLDTQVIRAIKNLLLGSVSDLDPENISITDTNGNVYSSIMSATDDMMKLLEDNDNYMKNKIIAQLDKLLGKGNYVVTVSTYLRETPMETDRLIYNPNDSSVGNKQRFTENLGDQSQDKNTMHGAVSSFLPPVMSGPESSTDRSYSRSAEEYNYKVGQTRVSEIKRPGTLEEISIAVTINKGSVPEGTDLEELKELIATTASPKAKAQNVKIAFSDKIRPYLTDERPVLIPPAEESGNPWWTIPVILGVGLLIGLVFIHGRTKSAEKKHKQEIESIMEIAKRQEQALEESNQRTLQLQQVQQQMYQQLAAAQQAQQQQIQAKTTQPLEEISPELGEDIDEDQLATTLSSWIESSH